MGEVTYTLPVDADAVELTRRLRTADTAELNATGAHDHLHAIRESVRISSICATVRVDGALACIVGCAPLGGQLLTDVGVPWMLGTEVVRTKRKALMRTVPAYIETMLRAYPQLVNFAHAHNAVALTWLRRMKFELAPAAPFGPYGEPFHRFEMKRHV